MKKILTLALIFFLASSSISNKTECMEPFSCTVVGSASAYTVYKFYKLYKENPEEFYRTLKIISAITGIVGLATAAFNHKNFYDYPIESDKPIKDLSTSLCLEKINQLLERMEIDPSTYISITKQIFCKHLGQDFLSENLSEEEFIASLEYLKSQE